MFAGMRDVILSRMELEDQYVFLKRNGIKAMEVRIQPDLTMDCYSPGGEKFAITDSGSCERVLDATAKAGLKIESLLLNTRYHDLNINIAEEKHWIDESARFAQMAGLEVMRIDIVPAPSEKEEDFRARLRPILTEQLKISAESGVGLAVENHGSMTNRREFLSRLLDEFAPLGLSVTLDTGNFYCTGGYPLSQVYEIVQEFASSVTHVHVKNIKYPVDACEIQGHQDCEYAKCCCPIDEGDVNHPRIFAVLKNAGYEGGVYIEDESLGKVTPLLRREIITRTIGYLNGILEGLETNA